MPLKDEEDLGRTKANSCCLCGSSCCIIINKWNYTCIFHDVCLWWISSRLEVIRPYMYIMRGKKTHSHTFHPYILNICTLSISYKSWTYLHRSLLHSFHLYPQIPYYKQVTSRQVELSLSLSVHKARARHIFHRGMFSRFLSIQIQSISRLFSLEF